MLANVYYQISMYVFVSETMWVLVLAAYYSNNRLFYIQNVFKKRMAANFEFSLLTGGASHFTSSLDLSACLGLWGSQCIPFLLTPPQAWDFLLWVQSPKHHFDPCLRKVSW